MLEQSCNCQYTIVELICIYSRLDCLILSDDGEKGKTWIDTKRLEDSMKQRGFVCLGFVWLLLLLFFGGFFVLCFS